MYLKFQYNFNIEDMNAEILLNYEHTRYLNTTQTIKFIMKGDGEPLKVETNTETYKRLRYALLGGGALNFFGLFIGFLTPKFIGLESILTLQIIYYSQLLIYDMSKWPISFNFLKYLRFTSGYNDILQYTEYSIFDGQLRKMNILQIKKLII